MARIYLSPPHMGPDERSLLLDAFDSNWIAPLGPHVDAFEAELADYVGLPHAAALSSGTAALQLALDLVGVKRGDRVISSSFTFAATANAITYVGAEPVFVDSERYTWNIDPVLLEEELAQSAKNNNLPAAVVVVDLYGQCADYNPIVEVCGRYGVPIIEDAAEALGATYDDRPAGSFGELSIFSFNGNKIITTSGGGMLVSHSQAHIERARFLATQARDPAPHYQHSEIGYNFRMSNLLAAVGRGQLQVLDDRVDQRRLNNRRYREAFADVPGISFMPEGPKCRSTFWLTCVLIDTREFGASPDDIRLALAAQDIECRPTWKPMHLQPVFSRCEMRGGSVTEDFFARGLCLPSGSSLSEQDLQRVVAAIKATRP